MKPKIIHYERDGDDILVTKLALTETVGGRDREVMTKQLHKAIRVPSSGAGRTKALSDLNQAIAAMTTAQARPQSVESIEQEMDDIAQAD